MRSTKNCLTCRRRIHELVREGSQFIIATHSPIVLGYPGATIYLCAEHGLEEIDYDDTDAVRLTNSFLDAKDRFLYQIVAEAWLAGDWFGLEPVRLAIAIKGILPICFAEAPFAGHLRERIIGFEARL